MLSYLFPYRQSTTSKKKKEIYSVWFSKFLRAAACLIPFTYHRQRELPNKRPIQWNKRTRTTKFQCISVRMLTQYLFREKDPREEGHQRKGPSPRYSDEWIKAAKRDHQMKDTQIRNILNQFKLVTNLSTRFLPKEIHTQHHHHLLQKIHTKLPTTYSPH